MQHRKSFPDGFRIEAQLIEQREARKEAFRRNIEITPSEITTTSLDEEFVKKAVAFVEKNMANADYSLDELIGILLGEGPEGEHPATWGLCRGGSREELSGVLHALQAVRCFTVRSENAEGRAPVPWGALHPVLTPYGFRIARREIADFTFVWPGENPEQQPRPGRTRAARGTGRKTGGRSRPCASRKGAPKGGNRG